VARFSRFREGGHTTEPADRNAEFLRLFVTHESKIRGYILCMVNHWADADDILQEAVIIMMKKFQGFDSAERFLKWALRVARFEALNHMQKRGNHLPLFSPAVLEAIEEKAAREIQAQDSRREALQGCIRKLMGRDQELLRLRYEVGATTQSVAETVGRSVDAVYKALNRIHHQLLTCVRRTLAQERVCDS
jgi:RNA polymerase sigma-70 factor (ECF subfamily)